MSLREEYAMANREAGHREDCSSAAGGDCTCGADPYTFEDFLKEACSPPVHYLSGEEDAEDPATPATEVTNLSPVAWERMGKRVMLKDDDDIPF